MKYIKVLYTLYLEHVHQTLQVKSIDCSNNVESTNMASNKTKKGSRVHEL